MSTICLLDPSVRMARTRRRTAVREAQNAALRSNGLIREAMVSFAHRLMAVIADSRWPGWLKEIKFKVLFQQLRNA